MNLLFIFPSDKIKVRPPLGQGSRHHKLKSTCWREWGLFGWGGQRTSWGGPEPCRPTSHGCTGKPLAHGRPTLSLSGLVAAKYLSMLTAVLESFSRLQATVTQTVAWRKPKYLLPWQWPCICLIEIDWRCQRPRMLRGIYWGPPSQFHPKQF